MNEMIKQIAQIDFAAVSNRRNSEQTLKEKKEKYEKEMMDYREERLKNAHERAKEIYNQMIESGEKEHDLQEEKCKQLALVAQNRYLELEDSLLEEVFNKLFKVEA